MCEESHMQRMRLRCSFPLSLSGRKVIVACMFMHGSSEQAVEVLPRCLVQKGTLARCLFILLLMHSDPAVSKTRKGNIEHDPQ